MTRRSGALRILQYNWPVYAATWAGALGVLVAVRSFSLSPAIARLAEVGAGWALGWSLLSLLISFYVYDVSELSRGRWVPALLRPETKTWATVHAGLDAEVALGSMPGRCIARLDVFDPRVMTSPSIARARERTQSAAPSCPCSPASLALRDESCDAIVVAFTAHEIREDATREAFFAELRRALRPRGRALVVEHLRDGANFLAFGPGFLHFVARGEWLRLARHARLSVAAEARITPFVMALVLEKTA